VFSTGDVSSRLLGLLPTTYADLAHRVDVVLHNAALVNHALSYRQLFGANVLGTVNLLKFSLTGRAKAFEFVSTVGVPLGVQQRGVVTEKQFGSKLSRERRLAGYASGYGATKWVCETILEQLAEQRGLHMGIYRCSMIMPHSRFSQQINAPDTFVRLLQSMILTRLAPSSFMAESGVTPRPYDGLPVDFVAKFIARISTSQGGATGPDHHDAQSDLQACPPAPRVEPTLYHVVNPYPDGAALDDIVTWVQTAGYPLERVPAYDEWFARFKRGLEGLGAEDRQASLLPLIGHWAHPQRGAEVVLDSSDFVRAVRETGEGEEVPRITQEYVHACLRSMVAFGLIKYPPPSKEV
jgi:fatty acid CoA ligase FadD9